MVSRSIQLKILLQLSTRIHDLLLHGKRDLVIHLDLIDPASLLRNFLPALLVFSVVLPGPIVDDTLLHIVAMNSAVLDESLDFVIGDHDQLSLLGSIGGLVEDGGGEEVNIMVTDCTEFLLGERQTGDTEGLPLVVCSC